MHRKFIALILAASVAVTGMAATPAFADGKTARQFGWLALLGVVALAIQDSNRKRAVTHNSYNYTSPTRPNTSPTRPQPPQINRSKILPYHCLRAYKVNGQRRNLFGLSCLQRSYSHVGSLPYACQLGSLDGRNNRVGYEPVCLRERGYRTARR